MTQATDPKLIRALVAAYEREIRAANLYTLLAQREPDPARSGILQKLADSESKHARQFSERIVALGGTVPSAKPLSAADKLLARSLGVDAMLRRMEAAEESNMAFFHEQTKALASDPESLTLFTAIEAEEQSHTHWVQRLQGADAPATRLEAMLKGEKWHVSTGSWIGDAIYGVNDGLGAVFGIVSGMAGYTGGSHQVVVAGLFGMLASALSMGSGAYLATKSEREVYEAEIARERKEIEESPEHETEELALIFQLKGLTEADAQRMAEAVAKSPDQFLKTMAQEELGLSEHHFPNPWIALGSATLSTAIGALIPVIPFFFLSGMTAVLVSAIISTAAHFAVGAAKSLVTARSWLASGTEMTVVGLLEAVITFGLGLLFKVV